MQKQPFLSSAQHGNSFPPVNGKSVAASYLPQLFLTVWGQVRTLSQRRRTTYLSAAWVHSSSQSSLGRRGELRAILPVPTLQGCSRAICCKVWERMGCFVVSMPLMFTGLGNRELRKGNCAQGTFKSWYPFVLALILFLCVCNTGAYSYDIILPGLWRK